jgi:WD40 repeat protein
MSPGRVEVRDNRTGKVVHELSLAAKMPTMERICALSLSRSGETIAVAGVCGRLLLCSLDEPVKQRELIARVPQESFIWTQCVAFSPNDKSLLIAAGWDLRVYDFATLQELLPSQGHRGPVGYVAFSADGKRLLTGSGRVNVLTDEVARWDVETWQRLSLSAIVHPRWDNGRVVSPEHTYFTLPASSIRTRRTSMRRNVKKDPQVELYSFNDGEFLGHFEVPKNQWPSARGFFSPGSNFYVLAAVDERGYGIDRVYAVPSGKLLCRLPPIDLISRLSPQYYRPIAFSPDERSVAVLSDNQQIRVFDTATGAERYCLGEMPKVKALLDDLRYRDSKPGDLCFSNDSRFLASWLATDGAVRIWDMKTGKDRLLLYSPERAFAHLAFSPDGRMLAVGNRQIQLWELASAKLRKELRGHQGAVLAVAFSPDSRLLASGSVDSTVLIWDLWGK